MKKHLRVIISLGILVSAITAFSIAEKVEPVDKTAINLFYQLKSSYFNKITPNEVEEASSFYDLIENIPLNIDQTVKHASIVTSHGHCRGSMNVDFSTLALVDEHKALIREMSFGQTFYVYLDYFIGENETEINKIQQKFTLVPETEATYKNGDEGFRDYLLASGLNDIKAEQLSKDRAPCIEFLITEKGKVENVLIEKSSGKWQIDKQLVEIIENMPRWIPAKNSDRENVPQSFSFDVGPPGC